MRVTVVKYVVLSCMLLGLTAAQQDDWTKCWSVYQRVMEMYGNYTSDDFYIKYRVSSVSNNTESRADVTEISSYKEKTLLKNGWMTHFVDGKSSVMILPFQQLIIIKDNTDEKVNTPFNYSTEGFSIDSLKKIASSIQCSQVDNLLELELGLKLKKTETQQLSWMKIVADVKTQRLVSGEYHYYGHKEKSTVRYDYLAYRRNSVMPYTGTAISQVLTKGSLKSAYAGYRLQDLRKNHLSGE